LRGPHTATPRREFSGRRRQGWQLLADFTEWAPAVLPSCPHRAIVSSVHDFKLLLLKLRRLLRSRGSDKDDADDLIQEAFLRLQLYCREHQVEHREAFLVRTVLNLASDRRRHRAQVDSVTETLKTLHLTDTIPSAVDVLAARERLLHMKEGLDRLSPRRREVFVLNRIEGYSFPQIAERLGITLSAVEKHAAKALLLMTEWMGAEESEGARQ
jgi:RNA polymerase sigma factor (sigma-70 family)